MAEASSTPPQPVPPAKRRKSGVIVPHSAKWYQRLGAFAVFVSLRVFLATVRCRLRAPSEFFAPDAPAPVIFCIWHNRLAMSMEAQRIFGKIRPSPGLAALVSASKDGGLLAAILEKFKVQPVRGSSSRRGPQALLELTTWAERGYDLAITPDGPRGPCYIVQEGVISTAQLTGLPIVPVSFHLNWKIRAKSWDRFQIPLPFARCEITIGKVLRVPRETDATGREELRKQLEAEMRAITRD